MHSLSSRDRTRIRRLVRRHGLRLVSEVFGIQPGQLARLQAGERAQQSTLLIVIDAFRELGPELGLDAPEQEQLREQLGGTPSLTVIPGGRQEGHEP